MLIFTILSYLRSSPPNVLGKVPLFSTPPFGFVAVAVGYFVLKMALPYCYMYCVRLLTPPLVDWLSPSRPVLPITVILHEVCHKSMPDILLSSVFA